MSQAQSAAEAFRRIHDAAYTFLSRNDQSGTHMKELSLWRAAGVYRESNPNYHWVAETMLQFSDRYYATARGEIVDKDELFAEQNVPAAIANGVFRIKALTLGYSRDVISMRGLVAAAGANVTGYSIPSVIKPYYGDSPHSFYVFLRIRGHGAAKHGGMQM